MLHEILILLSTLHTLTNAQQYTKNRIAYPDSRGESRVHYAPNYEPIYGTLQTDLPKPINQIIYKTAASYYKPSNKTHTTYNNLGVETTNIPVDGEEFCLCFSLKDTTGKMEDFCMLVTKDGGWLSEWTFLNDRRANGRFVLGGVKALPQFPDVDIESISATRKGVTPTVTPVISVDYVSGGIHYHVVTTLIPSIATLPTGTRTIISTLPGGAVTTSTQTLYTTAAVVQTGYPNTPKAISRSSNVVYIGIGIFVPVMIAIFL